MIIGSGLIGTEMKKIDTDDILIFCSGPSVSIETSQKSFQREIDLFSISQHTSSNLPLQLYLNQQ